MPNTPIPTIRLTQPTPASKKSKLTKRTHLPPSFDISVDSTYDPEIGELLLVKKKSRKPLDQIPWEPPLADDPLNEKEKWWSIGRAKQKPQPQSNAPDTLAVPGPPTNSGSIALRAIRSVRSLARIGGWGQHVSTDQPPNLKQDKKKKKKKETLIRASTSSFEAGALSPQATTLPVRPGSSASSIATAASDRLSVQTRLRGESTRSSLRPLSSSSGVSKISSRNSIRWDEQCLESVKERRKKDRERKAEDEYNRKSLEGRRRTLVSDVFPEVHPEPTTPLNRPRPRPVSEQLLVKPRPKAIYEDDEGPSSFFISLQYTQYNHRRHVHSRCCYQRLGPFD
jgi:hypothetical protein